MCTEFCKWCKAWTKSFTKTEIFLAFVDLVLLLLCIALMLFVIIHLLTCSVTHGGDVSNDATTLIPIIVSPSDPTGEPTSEDTNEHHHTDVTDSDEVTDDTHSHSHHTHVDSDENDKIQCSWEPSVKTVAPTHYYKHSKHPKTTKRRKTHSTTVATRSKSNIEQIVDDVYGNLTDGEVAEHKYKQFVVALVKIKNSRDVTFGCILTIVSPHWTLTAASCVESIEEVDNLDSFVMSAGYGQKQLHPTHGVSDVQIHPEYQGANKSHDLAALKTDDNLVQDSRRPVQLPSLLDYLLLTIGEKVTILGYGKFRSNESRPADRQLNRFLVYWLPSSQCPAEEEHFSLRHLVAGAPVRAAAPGVRGPCAGVLHARGAPCQYCAGTPLLRGTILLGLMADNQHCAAACEPALYVNMASTKNWIDSVLK